jgi:hypothetical protein
VNSKPIEMISIPEHIREVLFKFHWDKVLVDVRRTINLAPRGKVEVYTAMTAVGNFQVNVLESLVNKYCDLFQRPLQLVVLCSSLFRNPGPLWFMIPL